MRIPKALENLADEGIIQEVIRPLMSGKEAQVYLVVAEDRYCAAKIYKDAQHRSFKNRADYTEGRKVRNSRDQRAMAKGTRYGKRRDEDAWKHTEVEMIYRLHAAGVRVPKPYVYMDGVLLMELVTGVDGQPARRLGDLEFTRDEASAVYQRLIQDAARMLHAGIVHGDLSEYNVLLAADGPVIIDFPQSINAAGNHNAKRLFLRDVSNLFHFLRRWVPGARKQPFGEEMWELFEKNELTAETKLSGKVARETKPVDTREVLELIGEANRTRSPRHSTEKSLEDSDSAAPKPMRRREVIVEKPASRARPPRGRRNGSEERSPSGGRRTNSSRTEHGRSNGARHPAAQGAERRTDGRRQEARRKSSRPKRGDGVQACTYVSPEARTTKVMKLSPREPAKEELGTKNTGADEKASAPTKRRRRRRNKGKRDSANAGSVESQTSQSRTSAASRRQRR